MHRLGAPQLLWGKGRPELVGMATVVRECRRGNFGQVVEVPAYWAPPVMVTSAQMAESRAPGRSPRLLRVRENAAASTEHGGIGIGLQLKGKKTAPHRRV